MSYLRKIEYCIMPKESYKVIHNCSGCGGKSRFVNTKCFRVNANGSKIDVWLIYQCEKCKHTLNIPIHERKNPSKIPQMEYQLFLANDETLAEEYARTSAFFLKNRLEIDWSDISYQYIEKSTGKVMDAETIIFEAGDCIVINNPYGIKLRPEKQAAEVLNLSRSQIKKLLNNKKLVMEQEEAHTLLLKCFTS